MEFYRIPVERRAGHTFRRHFPVWLGLVCHHIGGGRRWNGGVYLRIGDRAYILEPGRLHRQADRANLRRLYRRVTALEKALDAADVTRQPVD